MILRACVSAALLCVATLAQAHDGKLHKTPAEA